MSPTLHPLASDPIAEVTAVDIDELIRSAAGVARSYSPEIAVSVRRGIVALLLSQHSMGAFRTRRHVSQNNYLYCLGTLFNLVLKDGCLIISEDKGPTMNYSIPKQCGGVAWMGRAGPPTIRLGPTIYPSHLYLFH